MVKGCEQIARTFRGQDIVRGLILLARPTRFELVTSAFGGQWTGVVWKLLDIAGRF